MITEANWGRLYQYNAIGDAGIIMPFRSYYFRNFISSGWNDLALGLIYRACGAANDNANLTAERLTEYKASNLFHFGLSKATGNIINVESNPTFLGVRGVLNGVSRITTSPLEVAQLKGTLNGITSGPNIQFPLSQGISATPFCMFGLRIVFNPTTNQVFLLHAKSSNIALADEDANITTLQNFLTGISNVEADANASFSLNDNTNYSTFYVYWPYLLNRLQLHTVGAIKFQ